MLNIANLRSLLLLFLISAGSTSVLSSPKSRTIPKKDLSESEKQWCFIVDSVVAESSDLQPAMRSFVLDMGAIALKKCATGKIREVLVEAFISTLAIPETEEDVAQMRRNSSSPPDQQMRASEANVYSKQQLQTAALSDLLAVDETKAEQELSRAEPDVRNDILNQMIARALSERKLERASNLLRRAQPETFPYSVATRLMLVLPRNRNSARLELFQNAMAADHSAHSFAIGGDDFGSMIVRFWKYLTPALALEAIHQVLDGARENKDKDEISLKSGSDTVRFSSEYEYRLFELMPIVRQLDPDEAKKLETDSQVLEAQLSRFPNGIQSLDPTIRDTPLRNGESSAMRSAVGDDVSPIVQESSIADTFSTRTTEIEKLAESNPKQAIEAATALPNSAGSQTPQANVLLGIAEIAMTKSPSSAADALQAMAESLKNIEPTGHKGSKDYWVDGIELAVKIGDTDLATELLKRGMDQVEKLKNRDTDSEDPNLALKAWWPSTVALCRLVSAASNISPLVARHMVDGLSDSDLHLLCLITLANKQLGLHANRWAIIRSTRSGWAEYGTVD